MRLSGWQCPLQGRGCVEEMQTFSLWMCHIQGAQDLCKGRAEPPSAQERGLGPGERC